MKEKEYSSSNFGARLKEAFNWAPNSAIAQKLELSPSAITNYMEGRIPPAETLIKVAEITGYSLHWLITGDGPKTVTQKTPSYKPTGDTIEDLFLTRLNLDKTRLQRVQKLAKGRSLSSVIRELVYKALSQSNQSPPGSNTQLIVHLNQSELYNLVERIILEVQGKDKG